MRSTTKIDDLYTSYWDKIKTNQPLENDMVALFYARVAAFINLTNPNKENIFAAKNFLLSTMLISEIEYNFPSKEEFIKNVTSWEKPVFLASKNDDNIHAIVYKINYIKNEKPETIHEISFFNKDAEGKYKFSHKYNLTELYDQFCKSTADKPEIRQIGDATLHQEAQTVNFSKENATNITRQLDILKSTLTKTGGVGIAANQCAQIENPLKIVLSGVDYDEPEHVIKAITRYPTTLFPQMIICINPIIEQLDVKTTDFAEGCLSVHGIFRGSVKRPQAVTVRYQDQHGIEHKKNLSGSDARVMLHELDHILNGKVYIQRIIDEMSDLQRNQLLNILSDILSTENFHQNTNPFLSPLVIFERDNTGALVFDSEKVKQCLIDARRDVLISISNILNEKSKNHLASGNILK